MSDSVRPHRRQPTRLPSPWDSPGKNIGVCCHFLLQCMKVKSEREVAQSCLTLSDPMDYSLPGSSIHGIFQARVLEWGAIAFSEVLLRQFQIFKGIIVWFFFLLWNIQQVSSRYAFWMKRETDCWPSTNSSFPVSLSLPSLIQEPLENLPASLAAPSVCLLYIHSGLWLFFSLHNAFTIYFLLPEIWQKLCSSEGLGFCRFMSIFAPYYHIY